MKPWMITAALALAVGMAAFAQSKPEKPVSTTQPAAPLIGEMRLATLPGQTLLYVGEETTLAKLQDSIAKLSPKIFDNPAVMQSVCFKGPVVFLYHDMMDPEQPFDFEIAMPVAEDTKEVAGCKVKKTEPFRCATILYTGVCKPEYLKPAYRKLHQQAQAAGLRGNGEYRENYLYWEGVDSPNNVIRIEMGLQEEGK